MPNRYVPAGSTSPIVFLNRSGRGFFVGADASTRVRISSTVRFPNRMCGAHEQFSVTIYRHRVDISSFSTNLLHHFFLIYIY